MSSVERTKCRAVLFGYARGVLSDDDIAALGDGEFVLRDGLLGPERALDAARAAAALPGFRPAAVGADRRLDPQVRADSLLWLDDPPPALRPIHDVFTELQAELNAAAYLGLDRFELQVARYPGDGAGYARHRDALRGRSGRVLTAIYYLNPAWDPADGGLLRLHLAERHVDIEPVLDRLVLFLSARVEHEVLPAHAPRLAITAWYRRHDPLAGRGP
jgi:SM-20-related protein